MSYFRKVEITSTLDTILMQGSGYGRQQAWMCTFSLLSQGYVMVGIHGITIDVPFRLCQRPSLKEPTYIVD